MTHGIIPVADQLLCASWPVADTGIGSCYVQPESPIIIMATVIMTDPSQLHDD